MISYEFRKGNCEFGCGWIVMTSEMGEKAIDPAIIKCKKLSSGALIPVIGLGRFDSDSVSAAQIANVVKGAIRIGYRHIDCASVYGNEAGASPGLET